mmetsp:Transcript_19364/g.23132  ORF Transcript_19364/g.23132 Transcript_19364/m.23132 type:complete len:391 (+) Transcript_19364:86-1258(+)|eukprot:CAMPEP_0197859626 /NCGR_PEP_ID=MMETSP1438-20131217/34354_1 /TAXON_ID=1461541 /ORGANISM="Pterosperma sp., Strain CCMP1384" /LENGTH=390 /DNA_ID=CAMNT_0043476189 /DNA_START=86 /DNA_END=1258 /DNA_ORIENTATION=+
MADDEIPEDTAQQPFNLAEFRQAFMKCDKDGSGYVDKAEIKSLFISMGLLEDDDEADDIVEMELQRAEWFHADGGESDNELSYVEFLLYYRRFWEWSEAQAQKRAAQNRYTSMDKQPTLDKRKTFFQHMTADNKSMKVMFRRYIRQAEEAKEDATTAAIEANTDREMAIRDVFHKYDHNNSGDISVEELAELLVDLKIIPNDKNILERVMEIVREAEEDVQDYQDYKLSFQEFLHIYNRFVDDIKRDDKRQAKHTAKINDVIAGIKANKFADIEKHLTSNVVGDQPHGWAGYGGVKGKEAVFKMWEANNKKYPDIALDSDKDAIEACGSYVRPDPTMQRTIYLYKQYFDFTRVPGVENKSEGHVMWAVEEGSNDICEVIYHVFNDEVKEQ